MKQLVNAKDYGFFLRALCLAVILIGLPPLPKIQAQSAEYSGNVVDAENQVIYKIIKDTETVVISEVQSQGSNYGKLVLPKTVTDNNTESVTYGRTFTVVAMERYAFRDCPMKEVVIEAEIPEIPESAFENCYYIYGDRDAAVHHPEDRTGCFPILQRTDWSHRPGRTGRNRQSGFL